MMQYLLDTNALIRALHAPEELSDTARNIILWDNDIFVSDVSLWEIAIKNSIGKLELSGTMDDIETQCDLLEFERIAIKSSYFERLRMLPFIHRDPFDRLLVVQAMAEGFSVISSDRELPKYGISVIW